MKIFAIALNYPSHTREMKCMFSPSAEFSASKGASPALSGESRNKEVEFPSDNGEEERACRMSHDKDIGVLSEPGGADLFHET